MSVAKKYLEDVNMFEAFLNFKTKKVELSNKRERKNQNLYTYQATKLILIDLGKKLRNKYR